MDKLESLISRAEIAYKSGRTAEALACAKKAVTECVEPSKVVALKIFIARAYSKLGRFKKSNEIYRELLNEKVYIAPVVCGLFYNNFNGAPEKLGLNIKLVKSCLLLF